MFQIYLSHHMKKSSYMKRQVTKAFCIERMVKTAFYEIKIFSLEPTSVQLTLGRLIVEYYNNGTIRNKDSTVNFSRYDKRCFNLQNTYRTFKHSTVTKLEIDRDIFQCSKWHNIVRKWLLLPIDIDCGNLDLILDRWELK